MWLDKIRASGGIVAGKRVAFLLSVCMVLLLTPGVPGQQDADSYHAAIRGSSDPQLLPALLDFLLLAGILACFVISVKVKSFLRDGELASGWSLFSLFYSAFRGTGPQFIHQHGTYERLCQHRLRPASSLRGLFSLRHSLYEEGLELTAGAGGYVGKLASFSTPEANNT